MKPVRSLAIVLIATMALLGAACGDDSGDGAGGATTSVGGGGALTDKAISPDRCEANKAAGTITYLSSFDFAATPSIVDVVTADKQGYFDALCLDVDMKSSFSTANYPIVAADQAQFSSAGSYTELLRFAKDGARLVAVVQYGKSNISALLVRDDGTINDLTDLAGKTIGVKGALPPAQVAQLNKAGLVEGEDYRVVLLDGFDPRAHLEQPIDALPVYKSNEPGQLDRAGISYRLFDPSDEGIPGSFGILYTNGQFLDDHPTAAQDFVRASLKGMEDAIADPAAAVAASLEMIRAGGNKNFLSEEGESYRWQVEKDLVEQAKGDLPIGVIDPALLQAEVDAYTEAGVFDTAPSIEGTYNVELAAETYGPDGKVVLPRP
jgi:ABC-type nitrate/sulfonate/bicarbonate transport system substrate-binding protein